MANWRLTQVKSKIGSNKRQIATLQALGLKRMHHSIEIEINDQLKGMVKKVSHLIKVEEV